MTNKIEMPDFSKYPAFDGFMKKKDKFILDENNNPIPADLMTWGIFMEDETHRRIVKKENVADVRVSTVFIGLDHKFSLQEEKEHPDYEPHIFETMIFTDHGRGHEIYCMRYATWQKAEEGHKRAVAWVMGGCLEEESDEDENE